MENGNCFIYRILLVVKRDRPKNSTITVEKNSKFDIDSSRLHSRCQDVNSLLLYLMAYKIHLLI